jgi:hypothetical protein
MVNRVPKTRYLPLVFFAVVVVAGCGGGEPHYVVTGSVVEGGQPVVIEEYEEGASCVELEFVPLDESGAVVSAETYWAYAKEDGTFVIDGTDGSGIPAGKYRVSVRKMGDTVNGPDDLWQGAHSGDNSKFIYEITADTDDLQIDVASPPTG